MNNKSFLITAVAVLVFASAVFGQPWAGSGDAYDPYQIWTAEDMNAIGADPNYWFDYFKLMADIDLGGYTGTSFNIIGERYYDSGWVEKPFRGVFDGDGHTISNFTYTSTGKDYIGIFGYVDGDKAQIKNLRIVDPNIDAGTGDFVGALAGYVDFGFPPPRFKEMIIDCHSEGGKIKGAWYVGGLAGGFGVYIEMVDCSASSNVEGSVAVGGLVGYLGGHIRESTAYGKVSGVNSIGGLIGAIGMIGVGDSLTVINSYATGPVDGNDSIGGLVGKQSDGFICNCYSSGNVTGTGEYVGGLIGELGDGSVINSYWDVNSSGQATSAGGEGKTTECMQTASTFTGWGCYSAWTIDEGNDYPRLAWEGQFGVPLTNLSYWAGSGTEDLPYLIYTPEQLNIIGLVPCSWDKHFKLMSDIDLSGLSPNEFNMIGFEGAYTFAGTFDGNDHAIIGFNLTSYNSTNYAGLFGKIEGLEATIKDLQLIDPNIHSISIDWTGGLVGWVEYGNVINCSVEKGSILDTRDGGSTTSFASTGGLIGRNQEGLISKCYSTGSVISEKDTVGGLVGENDRGMISSCFAESHVSGDDCIGGLVGENYRGVIENSFSLGSVSGDYDVGGLAARNYVGTISNSYSLCAVVGDEYRIGGLAGTNDSGDIFNCYAGGNVSGRNEVGGLVGQNSVGEIYNCYSRGSVTGTNSDVGGLVGWNSYIVNSSFWDIETSGLLTSDGGTGLPTVLMQTESTFTDAGWDFVGETVNGPNDIWDICEGTNYPKLAWSIPAGDFICPDGVNMLDFAILGDAWFTDPNMPNWDPVCDISEPNDNVIDGLDLDVFTDNYLSGL